MTIKSFILVVSLMAVNRFSAQVLINEVMINPPSSVSSQFQSLKVCSQSTYGSEYIELYNTTCVPVDISCYFIGYRIFSAQLDGTFRFPAGTTIAPHGFISIGGVNSGATINLFSYCSNPHLVTGNDRWYIDNGDCYIALYNASGTPVDAVYWTVNAGESAKWGTDSDLDEPPTYVPSPAGCVAVASLSGPLTAALTSVVDYAGASPSMGNVVHRTTDGGSIWSNTGIPTINATNSVAIPCPLSVELLAFRYDCSADHLSIDWKTESETNNDYFELEYSKDGYSFENIMIVDGAGTSLSIREYHVNITDRTKFSGYYRLTQVDFDGTKSIEKIIYVDCSEDQPFVYFVNQHFITVNQDKILGLTLYDVTGRLIANQIPNETDIFAAGIYYVVIETKQGVKMNNVINPN